MWLTPNFDFLPDSSMHYFLFIINRFTGFFSPFTGGLIPSTKSIERSASRETRAGHHLLETNAQWAGRRAPRGIPCIARVRTPIEMEEFWRRGGRAISGSYAAQKREAEKRRGIGRLSRRSYLDYPLGRFHHWSLVWSLLSLSRN
jgi:hypothetical protein